MTRDLTRKGIAEPISTEQLADRLHSAAIHLLRRLRREDTLSGLAGAQLSALSVVVFAGPITMGDLAVAEQVMPATISRMVSLLEDRELVVREPDPADGRVVRVRATAAGERTLEDGRHRRTAVLRAHLDRLDNADLRALNRAAELLEWVVRPELENGD